MKTNLLNLAGTWTGLLAFACATAQAQPVSLASGSGSTAAGNSFVPVMSADGSRIAFVSHANNLTTNDNTREWLDVFVRDLGATNTLLASVNTNGVGGGNGNSGWPSFLSNTQLVFASHASDLVANDTNGASDIFLRDLSSQQTHLVSVDVNGNAPGDPMPTSIIPLSGNPIARIGGQVFFESRATNLTTLPVLTNSVNVYSRNVFSNTTVLVSLDSSGNPFTNFCELASVTGKGDRAAFLARSGPSPLTGTSDVYVRDLTSDTTHHASAAVGTYSNVYRCGSAVMTRAGYYVAFVAAGLPEGTVLFRYSINTESTRVVATNVQEHSVIHITESGRYITFTDGTNVFRWDSVTSTSELVNTSMFAGPAVNGTSYHPVATPDANTILFISNSSDLVPNGSTNLQVYSRDMTRGTTRLITMNVDGNPSSGVNLFTTISLPQLGRRAAFDSAAADLAFLDANAASDVFLFSVDGPVSRVTIARLPNGAQLTWSGDPAAAYQVEYKDTAVQTGWNPLVASISWNGTTATVNDTTAPLNRIYRVVRSE